VRPGNARFSTDYVKSHISTTGVDNLGFAGVVVAFQANQLPNPMVEVAVAGHPTYRVGVLHTLMPRFPQTDAALFKRLQPESMLTVWDFFPVCNRSVVDVIRHSWLERM
jgi:hypothetical protein